MGSRERRSTACPMLVMAYSGRNSRGISASCLSQGEPFTVLSGQVPGG